MGFWIGGRFAKAPFGAYVMKRKGRDEGFQG